MTRRNSKAINSTPETSALTNAEMAAALEGGSETGGNQIVAKDEADADPRLVAKEDAQADSSAPVDSDRQVENESGGELATTNGSGELASGSTPMEGAGEDVRETVSSSQYGIEAAAVSMANKIADRQQEAFQTAFNAQFGNRMSNFVSGLITDGCADFTSTIEQITNSL